jgi:hypothetical protein
MLKAIYLNFTHFDFEFQARLVENPGLLHEYPNWSISVMPMRRSTISGPLASAEICVWPQRFINADQRLMTQMPEFAD